MYESTLVETKSSYRQLVLLSTTAQNNAVRRIFSKFEEEKYIEYYKDRNITIFLTRFQLSFEIVDGIFKSKEFAEFSLAAGQQLSDCLYNFSSYLLLARESERKLILPVGDLERSITEVKVVCPSSTSYSKRSYYSYDEHQRFKYFQAADITSRLYLALIFCATSTLLPDIRHISTGAEVALDALRKCWQNTPMAEEQEKLVRLIQKQAWHFPALILICEDLIDSSMQTGFLVSKDINQTGEYWQTASDAGIEYLNLDHPLNIRSSLTAIEATRFLGIENKPKVSMRVLPGVGTVDICPCPNPSGIMRNSELLLESLITVHRAPDVTKLRFPIDSSKLKMSRIRKEVLDDLEVSWKAYIDTPPISLTYDNIENSKLILNEVLSSVSAAVQELEDFLVEKINTIPKNCDDVQAIRYRMMKAANQLPTVNKRDLMQIALESQMLHTVNPFLSQESENELRVTIIYWLELCVLQDKIGRLLMYASTNNVAQMIAELQVVRQWDVREHMEWLVFEVEGQLQIRPLQYIIARRLIDNPGSIGQLNMGEGKTRVILPMLVLHLAKGREVLRLHFLRQLLDEAFSYLHRYLCASVLNRKIFLLPFNRDVNVQDTAVLDAVIEYCAQSRGCFCIAPEQRLSLLLKSDELALAGPEEKDVAAKLRAIESHHRFFDILDEADEILRHKYELVYAVGSSVSLPSGVARWNAVQNILRIIDSPTNERLRGILSNDQIAVSGVSAVAFRTIRLLPGNNLETVTAELIRLLMEELIRKPPYDLIWIEGVRYLKGKIITFTTDASTIDEELLIQALGAESPEMESLLALRGLLSHGILIHCLQRSHRIHFGIKRPGNKRLAVPFFAADTPSERSEFQHPDVAILYTTLAYYEDGLNREELLDAFKHLLSIGPVAQSSIYTMWLARSISAMAPGDVNSLDDVGKVDLTNAVQRDLLVKYFCKNMETINYWLAFVVLPKDTRQYPERMSVNGWHLCSNAYRTPVGFSGTNDNKMLLPLQVKQIDIPDRKDLIATNGKMMTLIVKNAKYVDVDKRHNVNQANQVGRYFSASYWTQAQASPALTTGAHLTVVEKIITQLVREKANALIDAGGLIVGRNNRDVATQLAKHFPAVVYFDTDRSNWFVVDNIGRQWALSNSPIRERDAFVYFDDRRCRGSDMKLKPNAHAMLTVGPKMCKDKLMQAAGRMRQLDKGQTIFLAGCSDVSYLIQSLMDLKNPSEITSTHVLHWVLNNTILSLAPEGLLMWAVQGTHYCLTHRQQPGSICMQEKLSLYELYHGTLQQNHLPAVATKTISSYHRRLPQTRASVALSLRKTSQEITDRITVRGEGYFIMQTGLDEECERELQVEIDVEKEAEKQIPKMQAAEESDWDYDGLLCNGTCRKAAMVPTSLSLQTAVRETMQTKFLDIAWAEKAFCTRNFLNTVCSAQGGIVRLKEDYLRLIHFMLIFSVDGSMLLVSEREADSILRRIQQLKSARQLPFEMVDLAYCRLAVTDPAAYRSLGPSMPATLPDLLHRSGMKELVSVQLFAGETVFPTTAQENALKEILSAGNRASARQAALLLPEIRGLQYCIPRSDLERIVKCLIG